ncbi:hypothetical protein HTSR_1656 [Halodesulfurarchaeum formicicum]|uniref:Uncharacterized protein n=1 Tax=Halodesulfurarchaeum formicicum TaxID=1873524 RepID=A0A1D8S641_9EURY|nr:hypothetical protein [Halodesulfurarchaeum formicicum]AOW80826.1 hypothetical protein HTSR_1656 [Halodesulfurarchaeum formicicum]APE96161.1 hypothetical protein HSR6_1724 [Halodesulfurarchaeum formicicum]
MASDSTGRYHDWRSFLRCPDCGRDTVTLEHYDDGTMFRCDHCGAEAWAANVVFETQ